MTRPGVILFDLDDTLYAYEAPEATASRALLGLIASDTGIEASELRDRYRQARLRVKARIPERGSSHSRLLYLHELTHDIGARFLPRVRDWERAYWGAFIAEATLRDGALALVTAARRAGIKLAVVSDLTLEIQLWKLEAFNLLQQLDALVTSEEVPQDKPSDAPFRLALERLGANAKDCVMIGDSDDKDGVGAARLGIDYIPIDTGLGQGKTFREIAAEWELA